MAKKEIRELILKAIVDQEFRAALIEDADAVIKREGYTLTADEMAVIKELKVEEWDALTVKELDERLQSLMESGKLVMIGGIVI